MKRCIVALLFLGLAVPLHAQEETTSESTTVTTHEEGGLFDLSGPYLIEDAVPVERGTAEFRLRFEYVTDSHGTDDDIAVSAGVFWGPCPNVEVSLDVPVNLGDGGDTGEYLDGNGDLTVGMMYRFWEDADWYPAFALAGKMRVPTGDRSNGVDAEFRGILTKTITGDLRAHFNGWLETVNGNNDPDARHFQWGFATGVDFPLLADKSLYMVADYVHRCSVHEGASNMNLLEVGMEWLCCPNNRLNFSTQIGLDDNEDTPNFGVMINWVYQFGAG